LFGLKSELDKRAIRDKVKALMVVEEEKTRNANGPVVAQPVAAAAAAAANDMDDGNEDDLFAQMEKAVIHDKVASLL
jgi:hypothetical protein